MIILHENFVSVHGENAGCDSAHFHTRGITFHHICGQTNADGLVPGGESQGHDALSRRAAQYVHMCCRGDPRVIDIPSTYILSIPPEP